MSHPYPHYVYHYRRFGLFRRFWWFALGAGAASLWMRHHQHEDGTQSQRRCGSWRSHREIPQSQSQPTEAPPYNYDWASHRPGLKTPPPPAPTTTEMSEVPAAPVPPAPAASQPAPYYPSEEEIARLREMKTEYEAKAREFAAEKLERLSAALERIRESLKTDGQPPKTPEQQNEKRWV